MAMATTTYEMEAILFDLRLTLTDSFATDIALEGPTLASGPFGSGSCESW